MLSGHRVFRAKTFEDLIQLHLQAPITSLSAWRSDLPKALDDLIARAMAKEPAQRYLHPGEVANAYHQIIAPHDTQRVPIMVAAPSTTPSEQSKGIYTGSSALAMSGSKQSASISRRRALGFIAAGGGVVVAVLAVAVFTKNYLGGNTATTITSSTNSSPGNTPVANQTRSSTQGNVLARTSDIPSNSAKTFPIAGHENPGIIVHLRHLAGYRARCQRLKQASRLIFKEHMRL